MKDLLVVGIEEMYRNHPIPDLPNFKIVPWSDQDTIQSADIYIQNNIISQKRKTLRKYYQYILDSNKPFIVTESAVFRRNAVAATIYEPELLPGTYHRYSWFSYLRDEGNYNNVNCPPDRWHQIQQAQNIEIKDWRKQGDYVLFVMQKPDDSSLKNIQSRFGDYSTFIKESIEEIRTHTDRPIKIRLHPFKQKKQLQIIQMLGLKDIHISSNTPVNITGGDELYEDFKNAWAVVGYNSNALTESVCEGIPTFSLCPSSMAWECSNKDLSMLETPEFFERQQWLNNLGYCQWRTDEIYQGLPYVHLMQIYDQIKDCNA